MTSVLEDLQKLSSAEDFFIRLAVPYEPAVLGPARLHILRRMGEYLFNENLDGLSDAEVTERCRTTLERAYADFVSSSPIQQRVFKVLKEAVEPKKAPAAPFVSLDDLRL